MAPPTKPTARKTHRCIACGYSIARGERHTQQSGFFDGAAFRNRYHNECWDELLASDEREFLPYSFDPPRRLIAAPDAEHPAPRGGEG